MTQPAPSGMQIDMERVVRRASSAVADALADMAAQLAMAREVMDVQAARNAELEKAAEERNAEMARLQQTIEMLQQQASADDGGEGDAGVPGAGPGEG